MSDDLYDAVLIQAQDGHSLTDQQRRDMAEMGGHGDEDLGGMVFAATSFPAAIAGYMKKHQLRGSRVQVGYDPEWFAPPSPPPHWEDLPPSWDGTPPVIGDLMPLRWTSRATSPFPNCKHRDHGCRACAPRGTS